MGFQMSSDIFAISLRGVCKSYYSHSRPYHRLIEIMAAGRNKYSDKIFSLDDINLTVCRGETIGIIGRNGAGKSTLLQLICNTLKPSNGEVEVRGRVAALLELGAGFNINLSGRQNVILYAIIMGMDRPTIDRRMADIIAFADIGEFFDRAVKVYSSGMVVRLAFSVIAHIDADILIIDEALAVGDAIFTQKCMRFLRKFQRSGTIVLVSHDIATVSSFCSRVLWLEGGRCRMQASAKEVAEEYLNDCYSSGQLMNAVDDNSVGKEHGLINSPEDDSPAIYPKQNNTAMSLSTASVHSVDVRHHMLANSKLRNDLKIMPWQEPDTGFGLGGAKITACYFQDKSGAAISFVRGGEAVELRISCECYTTLESPVIGFVVKDKLGQTLFGDNSYLSYQECTLICRAGERLAARFGFMMPIMPSGNFSISVSIANGSQEEHVQHHWLHDAIIFESQATSLSTGLLGIPMHEISLTRMESSNDTVS